MSATEDFKGLFHVGQDSEALKAQFHVGQDSLELFAEFIQNPQSTNAQVQGVPVAVYVSKNIVT